MKKVFLFFGLIMVFSLFTPTIRVMTANAQMPFYGLNPKEIVFRSSFYTTYSNSSNERKSNIALAAKSLNNVLVDVDGEFSFNACVGARTERRGYKKAKIIVGGEFVDGVGGGVCQVSTTLYNAVLLSGLEIIEYHPHSLQVGYVAPSFDAMVNSNTADLKFVNNTKNPIIIKTFADGNRLKIEIYGEEMKEKYYRESYITETLSPPEYRIVKDDKNEYPDLFKGEQKIVAYAKNGYKSKGILIKKLNGKVLSEKCIRRDEYRPVRGVIVEGNAERKESVVEDLDNELTIG